LELLKLKIYRNNAKRFKILKFQLKRYNCTQLYHGKSNINEDNYFFYNKTFILFYVIMQIRVSKQPGK